MAIVLYDELLSEVAPYIPNLLKPTFRRTARLAAIDFCRESTVYRVALSEASVAAQSVYSLTVPAETKLSKIISIFYAKKSLEPASDRLLRDRVANYATATGTPKHFIHRSGNNVFLNPTPTSSTAAIITGQIAVEPNRASTGLESDYFEDWFEALTHGTLYRLFSMPGQAWSDVGEASVHQAMFASWIRKALARANQDDQPKNATVRFSW